MSITANNQDVTAGMIMDHGLIQIDFAEDPSYVRSESVLVDLMQRSIGIIFQSAYHHIGDLPKNFIGREVEALTRARLRGQGEGGREITLHAPVKIIRQATPLAGKRE